MLLVMMQFDITYSSAIHSTQFLRTLTSKSVKALYVRTRQPPKNIQVARFLVSVKDVTRGTDPICQSCESMAGHSSNQQFSAAK